MLRLFSTIGSWLATKKNWKLWNIVLHAVVEEKKDYIVIHGVDDVLTFVGRFVIDAVEEIDTDEMELVIKRTATCSIEVIAGFVRIMA